VYTDCDQEDCDSFEADAFYRYDPVTDRWDRLPLPPGSLGRTVAGTIGGKFYVTSGSSQIGVYDPATNQWTIKTAAGHPASIFSGVAVQAKLFALSIERHNSDGTSVTVMHTYDPNTNAWTSRAPVTIKVPLGPLTRVVRDGSPRIEIVGGRRPGNNLQYIP
jgi:N-acetylneuraminic acid mutarotase